jgi:ATP-binding cassette subfamily F protein uup
VLLVSHDRDFLDRTVTVTLGLDGSGKVDVVAGGYEDWAKRRAPKPARQAETRPKPKPQPQSTPPRSSKLSYKDQRDLDRLPAEIERIEAEIAKAEAALADPGLYERDPHGFASRTAALAALRAEKEAAEERWLQVAEMAEQLS